MRLHDKVARLENLLDSGRLPENEAVEDTYLDIVGYSTIGLMLLDGSFKANGRLGLMLLSDTVS